VGFIFGGYPFSFGSLGWFILTQSIGNSMYGAMSITCLIEYHQLCYCIDMTRSENFTFLKDTCTIISNGLAAGNFCNLFHHVKYMSPKKFIHDSHWQRLRNMIAGFVLRLHKVQLVLYFEAL
jgi:hypothetical protein